MKPFAHYISFIFAGTIISALFVCGSPLMASADSTSTNPAAGVDVPNDGILSCNQTGAYAMSVGSLSAVGSVYVPVNDAAVTLNTGYLVYLQCVLRPLIDRMREKATADMVGMTNRQFLTGGVNGAPMFSQNQSVETQVQQTDSAVPFLTYMKQQINPAYSKTVIGSIAQQYQGSIYNPYQDLTCDTPVTDSTDLWTALSIYTNNPACSPLGAYDIASQHFQRSNDQIATDINTQLDRGQGIYPQYQTDANGVTSIVTPGILLSGVEQQTLTSGFRQTESANDIGQMVSRYFTGMGNQLFSSSGGLVGLASSNGGMSYFDQVSQNASQGVLNNVTNIGLKLLTTTRGNEAQYYKNVAGAVTPLNTAANTIIGLEAGCWVNLIQDVCDSTSTPGVIYGTSTASCYTKAGQHLTISTSTSASTAVINAQIQPLAAQIQQKLNSSQSALNKIDAAITNIANTTSETAQGQAISLVQQWINQNVLPSQYDAQTTIVTDVKNAMDQLVGSGGSVGAVQQAWLGQLPDGSGFSQTATAVPGNPPTGAWCDTASPAVIQAWKTYWSK